VNNSVASGHGLSIPASEYEQQNHMLRNNIHVNK
jgi:hypothetical protein